MNDVKHNKILVIFPFLTHPVDAGNKRWVMSQVEELRALGNEVYMLCLNVPGLKEDVEKNRRSMFLTKEYWGEYGFVYQASLALRMRYALMMNVRRRFFNGHFKCDDLYPKDLSSYVAQLQKTYGFDACIVNYYWLTMVLEKVHFPKTAINTHDVFADKDKLLGEKSPWMCTDRAEEVKGVRRAQYVFTLQDVENEYFKALVPCVKVLNVYCPYNVEPTPLCGNHTIVMLASSNGLNIDGMEWFLDSIFPSVTKKFPDVRLVIGGSICKRLLKYANRPNIIMIGRVKNPIDLYRLGDVAINPCRRGTGLKVKTFEALSYGKVCMVHPHSTIGIYDKENSPIFASERADEWADFLAAIWKDQAKIVELKQQSIDYIESMNRFIEEEYKKFLDC